MSKSVNGSRLDIHEERHGDVLRCMLIYTGCFLALSFLVYFLFIADGRSFVRYLSLHVDAFAQKYAFAFEFKRFVSTLFQNSEINTWDWTIGLGADGYAFNISSLLSPSEYFMYLMPDKYVDLAYTITIIVRVYLSGVAFILFAKKIGLDNCQTIMGAIAYSFCPWTIITTIFQGAFVKASMLFPIVMLGEEKLIRRESPLLFILSVAYTTFTVFSFAYMIAFVVLLYFPIRLLTDGEKRTAESIVRMTILLIASGIAGIMLAGESFVITLLKFGETSGVTGREMETLWTITDYLRLPMRLVTWDASFKSSSIIGIAAIGVVMVPMIAYKAFRRETEAIMTAIMFIFVLFPIVNRLFNFFSYPTGRWMFMLAFFYALAAAECFDKDLLMKKESKIAITVVFMMYAVYIAWIQKVCDDMTRAMILSSCIACAVIIAIIWICFRPSMDSKTVQRAAGILVTVVMCAGIVFSYNARFLPEYELYLKVGTAQDEMNKSPQRVGPMIKDDSFWRIDQARTKKVNHQIYFGNRSEYVFYLYMDVGWLEYNKLLGNNQGYFKRTRTKSNDNRFGLDFLQGVKYFIGSYGNRTKLSKFAGFGYKQYKTIDGVEVLKNKYNIGPGCMFDAYIRRSEWEKLTYADREFAMLMGLIVPDDEEMPDGMQELKATDIKTGVKQVPYTIKANKKKTRFIISCENDDEHQLLMTFDNVHADGTFQITLNVENGNMRKNIVNSRGDVRGYPDMKDLTVNLGSGREAGEKIKVKMISDEVAMKSGVDFDDIRIYSMPIETYRKYAEKLVDNRINVTRFTNDHITGTVSAEKPEVLYFSIFDNSGWDVYVDGKKADIRDEMDIAFIGVDIEPGEHEIDVRHHSKGVMTGWLVTAAGLALTVILMMFWRRLLLGEQRQEGALAV